MPVEPFHIWAGSTMLGRGMWECLAKFFLSFDLQGSIDYWGHPAGTGSHDYWSHPAGTGSHDYWGHHAVTGSHDYNRFSLSVQGDCKVGKRRAKMHILLFEKLLLILKKKDAKHYTYMGHILVSPSPASVLLCVCVQLQQA